MSGTGKILCERELFLYTDHYEGTAEVSGSKSDGAAIPYFGKFESSWLHLRLL